MGNNKDVKEKERRTSKPYFDAAVAREIEKRHAKEKELAREREKRHAKEKELAREREKRHEKEKELARERERRHAKEKELAREKERRHGKEERSLISVPRGGAMTNTNYVKWEGHRHGYASEWVRVEEQVVHFGENVMIRQRKVEEKRANQPLHIDVQFGAQFKFPCSLPAVPGSNHHHRYLKG